MTQPLDAQRAASAADAAARHAGSLKDHPGFLAALARLERHYTQQFTTSLPADTADREDAYRMLRAVAALRQDLDATISGGEVTARNHRSRLKQ